MQYSYDFEIAAIVVMLAILIHFEINTQFAILRTKLFQAFLICCICESALNVTSSLMINYKERVPLVLSEAVCLAFFLAQSLSYYLFFLYALEVCGMPKQKSRIYFTIGSMPFALDMLLIISTPVTGFFYHFEEDGSYHQGIGANMGYYYIILYLMINFVMFLANQKGTKKRYSYVVYLYTVVSAAAIVCQFFFRSVLLTGMAHAVVLLNMYLALQNPREYIDEVTGVGNESAFAIQMDAKIKRKNAFSVVLVAVKQDQYMVNILGYENYNLILENVAAYLSRIVDWTRVFRIRNGTFVLTVEGTDKAEAVIEKITERFRHSWDVGNIHVSLRYGIAVEEYPKHFSSMEEFGGMSNYLLLQTNLLRDTTVITADTELREEYDRHNRIENALNRALSEQTLDVYYQPIYSVEEKRITSLEALVRLYDPELGFVNPEEFIELAEYNGSILLLQQQVLEKVCRFLKYCIMPDPSLGIETIHMNISVIQCMQQDMAEQIFPVLAKYEVPPEKVNLEITERAAVTAPELMQHHMKEFLKKGMTFSLDDYGTGNSNLSYLINFPFQKIKFDKGMIWSYFKNDTAKIVLENEFEMIKKLGIPVVAEGIETGEQSEKLRELGIEYIQGYYYGKPMNEKDCMNFLKSF